MLCKESGSEDESVVVQSKDGARASASSMSKTLTSQSGSNVRKRVGSSSLPSTAAAASEASAAGPMSRTSPTTSGSAIAAAASSSSTTSGNAVAAAEVGSVASESDPAVGSVGKGTSAPKGGGPKNPWNQFQQDHKGKGLSNRTMALMYKYQKTKGDPK
eukprot:s2912_g5.t1